MRAIVLVVLLVSSFFGLPSASAAEPLLTDATGDVQISMDAQGTVLPGVPSQGENMKASDLVALEVTEQPETLSFILTVAGTSATASPTGIDSFTRIAWGGEEYAVEVGYFNGGGTFGGEFFFAALLRQQGNDWEYVATLEDPKVDASKATITAVVPKVYFLGDDRRIPGRGDSLEIIQVVADTNFIGLGLAQMQATDAMPDTEGKAAFTLTMGDHSQGSLVMSTPERVRVSNGGATTFVFSLTLRNLGETEEEYAIATEDMPAGWNATLRSPVKVPPKDEKVVSLLVSVPFAHDHGGYSSFNVSAHSMRDPASNARMRLGVLHTPIPQPAGHHSELFLHGSDPRSGDSINSAFSTAFPFATGWMNTQADHAEDSAFVTPFGEDDDEVAWWIPLNPSLQMGLDFDVDDLGLLEGTLLAGRDGTAEIAAELYYYRGDGDGGEEFLLAEGDPVSITLAQSGPSPFEIVMTPTPEADYIPYAADAGMYLMISMAGADARDQFINTPLRVNLETETFKLKLPLLEYHDRLTGEAEAAQAVTIVAKGLVEKAARPGSVLTYPFEVRNDGPPDTFVFDLAGNDVAQARLVPRGEFALATGETREVTLAVEIPIDANIGQEYEALLFVHAKDDPSKMAIARTKTRATDVADEAMADESAELLAAQARENDTPGAGVAVLALALALALALVRRR